MTSFTELVSNITPPITVAPASTCPHHPSSAMMIGMVLLSAAITAMIAYAIYYYQVKQAQPSSEYGLMGSMN